MDIFTPFSTPTNVAQIVRPYDPNSAPTPVTPDSKKSFSPLIGLAVASLVVIICVYLLIKKRRHHR